MAQISFEWILQIRHGEGEMSLFTKNYTQHDSFINIY